MLAWADQRRRQYVHSAQRQFVVGSSETDFPDEVACCPESEPRAEDVADAEAFVLPCEVAIVGVEALLLMAIYGFRRWRKMLGISLLMNATSYVTGLLI